MSAAPRVDHDHELPRWLCALYDAVATAILFAAAYALRAIAPGALISWDEPAWVLRSVRFLLALRAGDWALTLQTGHPGVTTMWTGALSLNWHRLVTGRVSLAALERAAQIQFPAQVQDAAALRELAALLPFAKGGIWLANALLVAAAYLLLRQLVSRRMALVGGLALALSPYYTALSRLLHLDALAAGLMLLALLAALVHLERGGRWASALSGILTALAVLTRSAGLLVAPVIAVLLFWAAWRRPAGRWRALLASVALWAAGALVTGALLWPALWVAPLGVLRTVRNLSVQYATVDPGATATFFRGEVVEQAGPWFYPVAVWFRATPLAVVFGALALLAAPLQLPLARDGARRRLTLTLAGFALSLLLALTLASKKFDRYALPALLALDLMGGIGLALTLELLAERVLKPGALRLAWRSLGVALLGALLLGLGWVSEAAPLWPSHLLAYYNPVAGGLARAVETLPVGWGEGIPEAAAYLAALPEAEALTVATWAAAGVAPIFPGQITPLREANLPAADHVLVYIGDLQDGNPAATRYHGVRPAEAVVRLQGVPLAWLFSNDDPDLVAWLAATTTPTSVVVSNMDTALARAYPGLPWAVLDDDDLDAVAVALPEATAGRTSVVYLRYPWQKATGRLIQRQLDQSALLVEARTFFLGEARRYALLPDQPVGEVAATLPADARWESGLRLQAFGLAERAQFRQSVGVALRFAPERPQSGDWHLFARVLDEQGRVWGELDEPLVDRAGLSVSDWLPGETYDCGLAVPLRAGVPWGAYRVTIGLYELDGLRRLKLVDAVGVAVGLELPLGEVIVGPALIPASEAELGVHTPLYRDLAGLELLGYRLAQTGYATGQQADLALYWRPRGQLHTKARLALGWRVRDGGATDDAVTWLEPQPLAGLGRSPEDWRADEALEIHYLVPVPETLAAGDYDLVINLQLGAEGPRLVADDLALATVTITPVARVYEPPPVQFEQQASFGTVIALTGYDLASAEVAPGGEASLTLHWQALDATPRDLVVFVHLLDADGVVRGQVDAQPVAGARPTSGWLVGEYITDELRLPVDADAPPGRYRLEIGWYDPATLERLWATDAVGQPWPADAVVLEETITVE